MMIVRIPKVPFTMAEFLKENNLTFSPHDGPATRMIGKFLRERGYRRVRRRRKGDVEVCWTDDSRLNSLREKLE
jgi:hypothetical protein